MTMIYFFLNKHMEILPHYKNEHKLILNKCSLLFILSISTIYFAHTYLFVAIKLSFFMWRKLETFQYIMTNAFFAFPRRFSFLWKQTWLTFTTLMRSSSSQSCVLICLCVVLIVAIFNRQITFREILAWRNVNHHIAYNLAISVSLHYLSELKDIEVFRFRLS